MIIYIVLALVTVLLSIRIESKCDKLSYGYSKQQVLNAFCLLSVFLLLFAVSALRVNVGNDYAKYMEFFHLNRCKLETETVVPTEPGFNVLCIFLYLISGRTENYFLMFGVFAFFTVLLFLWGMYKQSDWFFMTFLMFMTLGYYFYSFSMVRYYFALAMAFAAIPYVLRKEWMKFVLMILIAATFHKSVLLVLPFYFLAQLNFKKWQVFTGLALCSVFVIFKDFWLDLFLKLYPTYEETEYLEGGATSFVAIGRCVAVLIFALILYKKQIKDDRTMKFYFYCNLGALVLYVFCGYFPSVSRAAFYLSITHILFIPALIRGMENDKARKLLTVLCIVGCVCYFAVFLIYVAPSEGLHVLPYQTFLYHEADPILSDTM